MANEYTLSYTAAEVNERLGKVDDLDTSVVELNEKMAQLESKLVDGNEVAY